MLDRHDASPRWSLRAFAFLIALALTATFAAGNARAQTPVGLGTSDSFAILAQTGITDTPAGGSTIGGDLGLNAAGTGITGITCVKVTGSVYQTAAGGPGPCAQNNPTVLSTATSDATTAYNNIAAQTTTATVGVELGAGNVRTAGVYRTGGVLQINGTLTLDGQGNADALFIFDSTATLTTGVNSQIRLINSAQACNVFFRTPTTSALGATSQFVGTIIGGTDITLGNGVTVQGRLLTRSGATAVTLINDTITRPSTCTRAADIAAANAVIAAAQAKEAAAKAAAAAAAAAALAAEEDAAAVAALAATAAQQAATAAAAAKAAADAATAAKKAKDAAAAAKAAKVAAAKAAAAKKAAKKAAAALKRARALAKRTAAPGPRFTG